MGRIKKVAGAKHEITLSPALSEFIQVAVSLPLARLPDHLKSLDWGWPYPRGDLYHWIPVLNHFDAILEQFVTSYQLDAPQTAPFTDVLLRKGLPGPSTSQAADAAQGEDPPGVSGDDGDRALVLTVVQFSRVLHENCGNRSIYASSERLARLLNSTDLELVTEALKLALRLAIRYHHTCNGSANPSGFSSSSLRRNHYNIPLENLQLVAESVTKGRSGNLAATDVLLPAFRPFLKDKGAASESEAPSLFAAGPAILFSASDSDPQPTAEFVFTWQEQPPSAEADDPSARAEQPENESPSNSAHPRAANKPFKPSRLSAEEVAAPVSQAEGEVAETDGARSLRISVSDLCSRPTHEIVEQHVSKVPQPSRFAFLTQLREAKAFVASPSEWHSVVAMRILALNNLVYADMETVFQQKMLYRDSDQPKQLQLVQQLTDLVQPPNGAENPVPSSVGALALECLEAFSKLKCRAVDVCSALNVNVSHGVLLYLLRKTVTELEEDGEAAHENSHFHEALIALLETLCNSAGRTPDSLVAAGLLDILVDSLKLRTPTAERGHTIIVSILNTTVSTARDAFQSFVNCKGLDVMSDLISWEVLSSIERVNSGQGFPQQFKSRVTDFSIPYFQQQTLRALLKFVNHLMSHNNANFERLLRNLIDSPPLLKGLRDILANGNLFGSAVWSGAVNVLSNFIHNEPTSYAVIAEAGLSKTLLEAILDRPLPPAPSSPPSSETSRSVMFARGEGSTLIKRVAPTASVAEAEWDSSKIDIGRPDSGSLASGILSANDAINAIPTAFGAICLHNTGLDLLLGSGVIETFFEIFESPDHINCLAADSSLPKNLGASFDELIRHHPPLKNAVLEAIILMVARMEQFCLEREHNEKTGARLFTSQQPADSQSQKNPGRAETDNDVAMGNASNDAVTNTQQKAGDAKITSYLGIVARFLTGFFENQAWCGNFITAGGLDFLLGVATSPALPYDFCNMFEAHDLFHVFHLLVEYKPHLVLPAVVTKLISILQDLDPLIQHDQPAPFFSAYIQTNGPSTGADNLTSHTEGTKTLKGLVSVHVLTNILHEAFIRPPYSSRSSHTLFSQMNLTDFYIALVKPLGKLYRVCVWEEIQLQNAIGEKLRQETRINGFGMGSDEADEVFGFRQASQNGDKEEADATDDQPAGTAQAEGESQRDSSAVLKIEPEDETHKKNVQVLRFLLSQIPSCITPFLQSLGRNLIPRRRIDPYQRQNAYMVAHAIAEVALDHLSYEVAANSTNAEDRTAYLIVAITSVTRLLIDGVDGSAAIQCLTLLLHAFKSLGGLEKTNKLLYTFADPLEQLEPKELLSPGINRAHLSGLKLLLVFYSQITSGKLITEAQQSQTLGSAERDSASSYYFNPMQLLVELRYAVLGNIQPLWKSDFVEKAPSPIVKNLIDIVKTCWETHHEYHGASEKEKRSMQQPPFTGFTISSEKLASLKERGVPEALAREALFRCINNREAADEYCAAHQNGLSIPKLPVPSYELNGAVSGASVPPPPPLRAGSEDTIPDADSTSQPETHEDDSQISESNESAAQPEPEAQQNTALETDVSDGMAMSIDNLLNLRETPGATEPEITQSSEAPLSMPHPVSVWEFGIRCSSTDLDELRRKIREQLIERVLEILSAHGDLTFELADLLVTAASSAVDAGFLRGLMGPVLVNALGSMPHDDMKESGDRIAALANLLAIVIQEKDFFEATVGDIQGQFPQLLEFITIRPGENGDSTSPWVGQTLLVIEKLLAEDVQPGQIKWTPPTSNTPDPGTPIAEMAKQLVSIDQKEALFKRAMDIIPSINKDQSMALSVLRILVILSRDRELAARMAEKYNIQKIFLMMKQLAGQITEKLQNTFLLVLRHIVEDEDTIRKIMKMEILQSFQSHRSRPMDTTVYVRNMHAHVLRAPSIFLEVTNELLKLDRFEPSQRPQSLVLKESAIPDPQASKGEDGSQTTGTGQPGASSGNKASDIHQPTAGDSPDEKMANALTEPKLPVVEHSDGVVHFILSQLLTFKDVDDRESETIKSQNEQESASNEMDVDVEGNSPVAPTSARPATSTEAPENSAETHHIHFYRVFLLQCLSELLSSYSKAKIEFINFSRKSDAKNVTPSKPRSAVLSYILGTLVPLQKTGSNSYSKKHLVTSNWGMCVIICLCSKTHETPAVPKRDMAEEPVDHTLSFVRRFVLEQGLKAFKDAQMSTELSAIKHSKLGTFADLFLRILTGRTLPNYGSYGEVPGNVIKEIAKIMYEKGYISALTNSISDVDLNLDSSRRLVKYVLRPLKLLTQSTIQLSSMSELSSTPGLTDEDDISTASSVTDEENGREETPDLYRNSVLSMAAGPDDDEDSESESEGEDEEMYDDDYDDTMDYEEEVDHDHGEVISDEDEEIADVEDAQGLPGDGGMHVTVVNLTDDDDLNDDDGDDSENDISEDDEDIDEVDTDTEQALEHMVEEINADDENDSLGDPADFDDDDDEGHDGSYPIFAPISVELATADRDDGDESHLDIELDADDEDDVPRPADLLDRDGRSDGPNFELDFDMDPEEDEDLDDDEEGDEGDDEDMMYPAWEDGDAEMDDDQPPWGWDDNNPIMRRNIRHAGNSIGHHHHHHGDGHRRGIVSPWELFPPRYGADGLAHYRGQRNVAGIRASDDNANPLLHRGGSSDQPPRSIYGPTSTSDGPLNEFFNLVPGARDGVSLITSLMQPGGILSTIQPGGGLDLSRQAVHLQITRQGGLMAFPPHFPRIVNRPATEQVPRSKLDPFFLPVFFIASTPARWTEEARLLYGTSASEKTQRVVNSLLRLLVPPAIEEDRIRREKEAEAAKKRREEEEQARQEQLAKDKADREERERKEKEELEAREAAEKEAAERRAREAAEQPADAAAMEGVETTATEMDQTADEDATEAEPSSSEPPQQRTLIRFGDREVDITHLGIDQEYLDALPEDLREEVLMQAFADQRSQQASAGQAPTDLDREFLDALPATIREELLAQEAQDRRRREREQARRQATANGGPANTRAEDMDTASFFATLDPILRNVVLAEQGEEVLAQLPPPIAAEARSLNHGRTVTSHRFGELPRPGHHDHTHHPHADANATADRKPHRRRIVSMLDKPGVAALLRTLFVTVQHFSRDTLNNVLENASQNRQNRTEILSILLSILQEGTADATSLERSFVHLSLRAKQQGPQKTLQTLKRTLSGQVPVTPVHDLNPLTVIQHCLGALCQLTENPHAPTFFLTEHENSATIKVKPTKKGKNKDSQESKYPLNALLSLLGRKLVMDSASCMEQLSSLLQAVTQPLQVLRYQKDEASEEKKEGDDQSGPDENPPGHTEPLSAGQAPNAEEPGQLITGEDATGATVQPDGESVKKQNRYTPPFVPESNLRLVVNILSARECSGKTFRDTLSTINNLSVIPGAKEIFGKELVKQAQTLAETITEDLGALVEQMESPASGRDVHGMALSKFSPSSSDQVKLLRVLIALDYIFDPKRGQAKGPEADKETGDDATKADILANLYDSWAFTPLWTRLGECLRSLRQRNNMQTTATILLPSIEALMVVCKNTQLNEDRPLTASKEFQVSSPAPESAMKGLFFRFTEEHRKVLNDLVRQNPRLMSGTFSLLVKNPKVLEFDNKRNYFTRRLHARSDTRRPQPPLQLSVRRDQTFNDSYTALYYKSADEIKYGKLNIRFHGEEGVDAGGVTREWFQTMSRQMFNPDFALFTPVASDRTTFHPNKDSYYNEFHLENFKFIGRIIGKALYEGRALDCHFSRAVYKRILSKSVSLKDMETLDLDYYRSLVWMLENDITDVITETFSVETDVFGAKEVVDLVDDGRNIPVTEENKQDYVQRVVEYRLVGSVKEQLESFLTGFHDIVPAELIKIFNEQELELLISGLPDIDVDDWKANTEYHNYSASSAQIQWFWRAVRSFDKEERAKLLQFVTGTAKVPLNGFKELEGMNGISRFNIHRDYGNKQRLPSSHTCFNQLDLPEYDDYEALRQQLYTAVTAGSQYFGFA